MNPEIFPRNIYIPPSRPEGISDADWERMTELSDLDREILAREKAKIWADDKLDDFLKSVRHK